MNEPHLWYPYARMIKGRKIICHVGPTNSGKTHHALLALENSPTGLYCGPLRLLAWEICEKLTSKGLPCNLITGQEQVVLENAKHTSCTIEMADLKGEYSCVILDEAQLLGDRSRGWAWTQALLGVRANEIHLCGSPSMLPVVTSICEKTGDLMTVKNYERLSPLRVNGKAIKSLGHVEPGDCVIGFSRKKLYEIKYDIERASPGLRCCVIYGNLPPEARQMQARLFNDETSGYDVLVASDAVGMGLNLAIRRIIFTTLQKFDGRTRRRLDAAEIRQVSGRAGRFASAFDEGEVSCLKQGDVRDVEQALSATEKVVRKAGLFPTQEQLELLGVFLDHRVTEEDLQSFWQYVGLNQWGRELSLGAGDGAIAIGVIMRQFDSLSRLSLSLDSFMKEKRHIISQSLNKAENLMDVNIDDNGNRHLEEEAIDSSKKMEIFYAPRTPLSKLLSMFKKSADLQGNGGVYFLCDLEERTKLAAAIDHLPMSFRDRYLFCMAPVNTDNSELVKWFVSLARQYAKGDDVTLSFSVQGMKLQRSPESLLQLESFHQMFDLYIWLGHRFICFVDMELAIQESKLACRLVDMSLRNLGPNATKSVWIKRNGKHNNKNKKNINIQINSKTNKNILSSKSNKKESDIRTNKDFMKSV